MIPECHPAAVWRPVHSAYYISAKPPAKVAAPPKAVRADSVTKIVLDVVTRTAVVTHNGQTKTFPLKAIDPFDLHRFYVNKLGYRSVWLGNAILLTKKGGKSAPQLLGRAA